MRLRIICLNKREDPADRNRRSFVDVGSSSVESTDLGTLDTFTMSRNSNTIVASLSILVVALIAVGVVAPVAAAESQVAIQSVTISLDTVEPGEPFIVEATLQNAESSDTPAEITQVGIRGEGVLVSHDDLGTIGSGETMRVPISLTLEEPGQRELTLFVHGRDVGGDPFYLKYPVYVTVEEPGDDVRMSITAPEVVQSDETEINVTVANGDSAPISSLELRLDGESATVRDGRRVSPTLAAGSEQTFSFDVRFDEPGTRSLRATLAYKTTEEYERTIGETASLDVEPLRMDNELSATVEQNGSNRNVRATLEHFGNVPVRKLVLTA